MTKIDYKRIVSKAKIIKDKAEKEYTKTGAIWGYYIAKSILKKVTYQKH